MGIKLKVRTYEKAESIQWEHKIKLKKMGKMCKKNLRKIKKN